MKTWAFISPFILQKIIWIPTRAILLIFGRLKISGLNKLRDLPGNAIFACNHTSEADPFFIPASLPFFSRFSPIFYTSREREFYKNSGWRQNFYGDGFFRAWGAYPVYTGLHNYEKSLVNHLDIVKAGGSICVFPEGGIPKDGEQKSAKGGVAYLAHMTNTPIVPVQFKGAYKMSLNDFFGGHRKIYVTFGEPIYLPQSTVALTLDDYKRYSSLIMTKVRNLRPEYERETVGHLPEAIGV